MRELGGPSFKPYQPDGIWEVTSSGRGTLARYVQDHGKDLYRRGIYGFIKLTVPPPSMLIFDASNRDQCAVERQFTNTPLQALVMMNDPKVVEAARVLSSSLWADRDLTPEKRVIGSVHTIPCHTTVENEPINLKEYY